MRKPIIAGNWKMNNTIADTKALITDLAPLVKDAQCDVVICTPYTDLATAVEMTKGTNIKVGAENVHWAEKGAFTGEISAKMLVELGVEYVIIGHSERRQYFGETDATVNARAKAALAAGLKLYPAIFGLLLLFDKKYKEAIRLVVYGILAVVIPFILISTIPAPVQTSRELILQQRQHL